MTWNDPPHRGERWRSSSGGKTETRTVIDRTLGAEIVYVSGRAPRHAFDCRGGYLAGEKRCTEAEWHAWAKTAKQLSGASE